MRSRWTTLGLSVVVAAAALVPLYGDPRSAPVSHAEWARMLLRALDMEQVLEISDQASQAFSTLSWKNSLAFRADRYLRSAGVEIADNPRRVLAAGGPGEVVYPVAVVRSGDYRLRLRLAGSSAAPAEAQVMAMGTTSPLRTFTVAPRSIAGWVDAGSLHLDPGAYTTAVLLPEGTALEELEVAPPCVAAVEPPGGWRATAVSQNTDVAVTTLKALDLESELPGAAAPVEVLGSDFQAMGPATFNVARLDSFRLSAGPAGLQAVVFVDLSEPGLYAVSTFGVEGGGQSWLADSCRKAVFCGTSSGDDTPQWRHLMTAEFTAGRHFFTVVLGPGAVIEKLRLDRKKDSPADYLATLRRLGFDPGPDGPVTRRKAVDAMNFIKGRKSVSLGEPCGDLLPTTVNTIAANTGRLEPTGPVSGPPPAPPNVGPGQPPVAPPAVPPQDPASPVTP